MLDSCLCLTLISRWCFQSNAFDTYAAIWSKNKLVCVLYVSFAKRRTFITGSEVNLCFLWTFFSPNFLVCYIWFCLFQHPLYHFLYHIRSSSFLIFCQLWATHDIFCTLTMIPYQTQHFYKHTPVEVQMGPFNIVYFRMRSHIKTLKIKNELLPKYLWCGLYGDAFWCLVKSCIRGLYNLLAWSGCIYNSWIQTITPSRFSLQFILCFRLSTGVQ